MRVSRTLFFSAVVVAELAVGLASHPTVISAAPATAEEINNNYQTVRSTKDSLGHKIFAQQQIVAKDNADVYRILAKKSDGSFQQIAATNDKHVLKKLTHYRALPYIQNTAALTPQQASLKTHTKLLSFVGGQLSNNLSFKTLKTLKTTLVTADAQVSIMAPIKKGQWTTTLYYHIKSDVGDDGYVSAKAVKQLTDPNQASSTSTNNTALPFDKKTALKKMTAEINALRQKNGEKKVVVNNKLRKIAHYRAQQQAKMGTLDNHMGMQTAFDRNGGNTWSLSGENLQMGDTTTFGTSAADFGKNTVANWYTDNGVANFSHRKLMLSPYMNQIGVALSEKDGKIFIVTEFGSTKNINQTGIDAWNDYFKSTRETGAFNRPAHDLN